MSSFLVLYIKIQITWHKIQLFYQGRNNNRIFKYLDMSYSLKWQTLQVTYLSANKEQLYIGYCLIINSMTGFWVAVKVL